LTESGCSILTRTTDYYFYFNPSDNVTVIGCRILIMNNGKTKLE